MVAAKDVSMEPTIRSLQDDLVGEQINDQNINEKNCKRAAVSSFLCDNLCLTFPVSNSKISSHSLSRIPTNYLENKRALQQRKEMVHLFSFTMNLSGK